MVPQAVLGLVVRSTGIRMSVYWRRGDGTNSVQILTPLTNAIKFTLSRRSVSYRGWWQRQAWRSVIPVSRRVEETLNVSSVRSSVRRRKINQLKFRSWLYHESFVKVLTEDSREPTRQGTRSPAVSFRNDREPGNRGAWHLRRYSCKHVR